MGSARVRTWGYWTRFKLSLLQDYLDAFTTACKSVSEIIYLDAFSGQGIGIDRITGEEFPGSAQIALRTANPEFTRLRYFELPAVATALGREMAAQYPGRDIRVYSGDCNTTIPRALADLAPYRWAPTFSFLDPDGMELQWSTLRALASHRLGSRKDGRPLAKVELWLLFPSAGLMRTLALDDAVLTPGDEARASALLGSEQWRAIYRARRANELTAREAREEYVNLLRWRLENDLGYRRTHPLEVKTERGQPLYHMVFATDNAAGDRIMQHLYGKAAARSELMRAEARARREAVETGQSRLFLPDVSMEALYEPEPPHSPMA